ncbi:hypothetical protein Hanom_Chr07g00631231 [Helianthus anomalus]
MEGNFRLLATNFFREVLSYRFHVSQLSPLEIDLYHRTFPTNVGVMGTRPLRDDEELWYEQIRMNFMYLTADDFADPHAATEGARILNPRPCRAITPVGEEVILLSSEESIA